MTVEKIESILYNFADKDTKIDPSQFLNISKGLISYLANEKGVNFDDAGNLIEVDKVKEVPSVGNISFGQYETVYEKELNKLSDWFNLEKITFDEFLEGRNEILKILK